MPQETCAEAERLWRAFIETIDSYRRRWPPFSIAASWKGPEAKALKQRRADDAKQVFESRQAYRNHLEQHGCKPPDPLTPLRSPSLAP